ncbi:hypothetical protein ONZ45_g9322 [Pleurotus djamor]|nr:hypothetical protein ONZ45_g9322 [Pleurotus djamor]
MSSSSNQPNTTLYVNNLNEKINKEELRSQLYALFTTYGKVIDVVASKSQKMRGQAFLVFNDLAGATSAMRACEGLSFYDKPLHIDYAKTKSWATSKKEDPNFVPPIKRSREDEAHDGERQVKREKSDDSSDDEEMEIDEDDEDNGASKSNGATGGSAIPQAVQHPTPRLLCTNLPQEVTESVLSVLFQQYNGYKSCEVLPSPTPNADGQRVKFARAYFQSAELATAAQGALNGFSLKKGWAMSVAYF